MRADVEATDLGVVVMMLCTVADVTGDVAPGLWRRYLPMLLDGLRPGGAAAAGVAARTTSSSAAASSAHKCGFTIRVTHGHPTRLALALTDG